MLCLAESKEARYKCTVKSASQVASPPSKPLLVYDGDCQFCLRWIKRWRSMTRDHIDYLPYQDPSIENRFPEIPREQFEAAVQLITSDGSVHSAARAVLSSLASSNRVRWLLRWYLRFPLFASCAEWFYRCIARHRKFFSVTTPL